jgi:hypothetical protein
VRRPGWLLAALVAATLAGCGGDDESGSSTQLERPPMTVPGESTDSTDSSTDTDATETDPEAGGSDPSTTGPMDQPNPGNGGVPAPDGNNPPADQAPEDSPSNDTPPEPGSPAERFEQFCAQNPGAC